MKLGCAGFLAFAVGAALAVPTAAQDNPPAAGAGSGLEGALPAASDQIAPEAEDPLAAPAGGRPSPPAARHAAPAPAAAAGKPDAAEPEPADSTDDSAASPDTSTADVPDDSAGDGSAADPDAAEPDSSDTDAGDSGDATPAAPEESATPPVAPAVPAAAPKGESAEPPAPPGQAPGAAEGESGGPPLPAGAPEVPAPAKPVGPNPNPLSNLSLDTLTATRSAPLFTASRTAPEVAQEAPPPPPPEPEPPPPPPEPPDLQLIGVVMSQSQQVALLSDAGSGEVHRLKPGEDYEGWTVKIVDPRTVELKNGDQSKTLTMFAEFKNAGDPSAVAGEDATAASHNLGQQGDADTLMGDDGVTPIKPRKRRPIRTEP